MVMNHESLSSKVRMWNFTAVMTQPCTKSRPMCFTHCR